MKKTEIVKNIFIVKFDGVIQYSQNENDKLERLLNEGYDIVSHSQTSGKVKRMDEYQHRQSPIRQVFNEIYILKKNINI